VSAGGADSESGSPACRPFRSIWLSDHIACIFNNLIGFSRHGLLSPLFSITLRKPFYLFQDTFRVRSDPFLAAMASSSPVSLFLVMVGTRREWMSLIQLEIPALLLDFCRPAWPLPVLLCSHFPASARLSGLSGTGLSVAIGIAVARLRPLALLWDGYSPR